MKTMNDLKISNQMGPISQVEAFMLFGPTSVVGSYLEIELGRISEVKTARISIKFVWGDLPTSFLAYYQGYHLPNLIDNQSFHVDFYSNSGTDLSLLNKHPLDLFAENAEGVLEPEKIFDLDLNLIHFDSCSIRMVFVGTEFAFGHQAYAETMLKAGICRASIKQIMPNQPFNLMVKNLSVSYL